MEPQEKMQYHQKLTGSEHSIWLIHGDDTVRKALAGLYIQSLWHTFSYIVFMLYLWVLCWSLNRQLQWSNDKTCTSWLQQLSLSTLQVFACVAWVAHANDWYVWWGEVCVIMRSSDSVPLFHRRRCNRSGQAQEGSVSSEWAGILQPRRDDTMMWAQSNTM